MQSSPEPVIEQLKTLDKAALLRVKYAVQAALRDVLPKGVVARHKIPATTTEPEFYLECMKTRCGRATCPHCTSGLGHGPYWYLFSFIPNENGGRRKRKSQYIGRVLSPELQAKIDATREAKAVEDPVRVEHTKHVGGSKLGHRAFRKVARQMASEAPIASRHDK